MALRFETARIAVVFENPTASTGPSTRPRGRGRLYVTHRLAPGRSRLELDEMRRKVLKDYPGTVA